MKRLMLISLLSVMCGFSASLAMFMCVDTGTTIKPVFVIGNYCVALAARSPIVKQEPKQQKVAPKVPAKTYKNIKKKVAPKRPAKTYKKRVAPKRPAKTYIRRKNGNVKRLVQRFQNLQQPVVHTRQNEERRRNWEDRFVERVMEDGTIVYDHVAWHK